ncbi:MAG: glutamate racemase [Deltaproteobacteria bacterium]|jgi:glutamate racemase|nr:glutamate racemase [Deltaproteobacteria bacterium]
MSAISPANLSIGVFDSGMGGLTVLSALMRHLPHEDMLYLGDTARLPYGTKSRRTVARYAIQCAAKLVERSVKLLVIACNTATAAALDDLQSTWPKLPIIGVINPGAQAACLASRNGKIAVIATESTINNGAYQKAIYKIKPDAQVIGQSCSLFVPMAEEGWMDGPIAEAVARRYFAPVFKNLPGIEPGGVDPVQVDPGNSFPDCLVLGCTHFPLLSGVFRKILGPGVCIVDSAETTAEMVARDLAGLKLLNPQQCVGKAHFMTTDDEGRFARIGALFLGHPLSSGQVELVNL